MIFSCGKAELSDSQAEKGYITRLERASDRASVGNGLKRVLGKHRGIARSLYCQRNAAVGLCMRLARCGGRQT